MISVDLSNYQKINLEYNNVALEIFVIPHTKLLYRIDYCGVISYFK